MSDTVKLNNCPKCGAPIPADAPQGLCPKCVLLGAARSTDAGAPPTATAEIPSLERVAAAFPQFEILELIGRGGMSFVFKARQPHLDRFVALKLLPDKLASDPRFTERFNREGRVLARLNHPNIVSVYDFGMTEHFYFLVMEFVDGLNLRQAMHAGRFSPGEALAVVPKICEALQYAHSQGILHRDIKPENILLDAQGHVKIADFGIAKLVGEEKSDVTLTGTGAAIGTPHYMAPEQLEKPADVDHRADIYSLGVVFYEMLTGELPIGRFAPPSSKTPVGTAVDEVVFRTLEKDRERRYQSAGEMKAQVEHLSAAGAGTSAAGPPKISAASSTVPKWSQKAIWSAVLTGLSLPLAFPLLILIYISLGGFIGPFVVGLGVISLPGLAGCILGWTALSDIRAHEGTLRGLSLALFAAFAWPLFLLVSVTLTVPWLMMRTPGSQFDALLALLIFIGTITFAIWAIYATARWGANKPPSQRRGVLKWVFIGLLLASVGLALRASFVRAPMGRSPIMQTEAVDPALEARFEPDVQISVRDLFSGGEQLALERKQAVTLPPDAMRTEVGGTRTVTWGRTMLLQWLADEGVDLAAIYYDDDHYGWGLVMRTTTRRVNEPWSTINAEVLRASLAGSDMPLEKMDGVDNTVNLYRLYPASVPMTFAVRTRAGRLAALQITGITTNDPSALKVRYKLLQSAPPHGRAPSPTLHVEPALPPSSPPNAANVQRDPSFGPDVEVTVSGLFSGGPQLALERKQVVTLPPDAKTWEGGRTTLLLWLADEGVDLAAIDWDDDRYGWGLAMRPTTRQVNEPWSTINAEVLRASLAGSDMPLEKIDGVDKTMNLYRLFPSSVPMTFAVRTRAGRLAALQITGITNNPPALKVRYKVAMPPSVE